MEHFYQNIQGWFDYPDVYNLIVNKFNNAHFVEIGAWKGTSTAYLAVEIINQNKNIKLDVVDTWEGSPEHSNEDSVKNKTLYTEFLNNMNPVKNYLTPIKMTSIEASKLYKDKSLDFVFIDANHGTEDVMSDLEAWYPKIKDGGVIAGHDYETTVKVAVDKFFENKNKQINQMYRSWLVYL